MDEESDCGKLQASLSHFGNFCNDEGMKKEKKLHPITFILKGFIKKQMSFSDFQLFGRSNKTQFCYLSHLYIKLLANYYSTSPSLSISLSRSRPFLS